MRNGTVFQQQPLVPRTSVIGSFSLPTMEASETGYNRSLGPNAAVRPSLRTMARTGIWPTPSIPSGGRTLPEGTTRTGMTPNGKKRQVDLGQVVKRWPTPNSRDRGKDGPGRQGGSSLNAALVGGQLNPQWVEWLMGFPLGWTDLGDSATPSSRKSRSTSAG